MAYTPPAGNAANFPLSSYTPPTATSANFELADVSTVNSGFLMFM